MAYWLSGFIAGLGTFCFIAGMFAPDRDKR